MDAGSGKQTLAPLLRKIGRIAAVPHEERRALQSIGGHLVRVAKGVALPVPSTDAAAVIVVIAGLVGEVRQFRDGRRQILAIHIPGDTLCTGASASSVDPMFPLAALSDCGVLMLDAANVGGECPSIAAALAAFERIRGQITREWLIDAGRRSAREAIAHRICEFHARFRLSGLIEGNRFALPLSQTDLADALALTIVTVNRILMNLKQEHLVVFRQREIDILDPKGLRAVCRFDDRYLLP